nr:TetR/AcrR family transcriptional regulator [Actinomycetota bacterium]
MARTPDDPTSTRKSQQRRADLLLASHQAFEDKGYVETSIADIIRIAGGSRASFYSYFTSKDDVLSILVGDLTDDLFHAATRPVARRATPFENLSDSIRQFMHAYRDRAPLLLVLDQATTVNPAFMQIRLAI